MPLEKQTDISLELGSIGISLIKLVDILEGTDKALDKIAAAADRIVDMLAHISGNLESR